MYVKISLKRLCPLYFWREHKKVLRLSRGSHNTVLYRIVRYKIFQYVMVRYGANLAYRTVSYRTERSNRHSDWYGTVRYGTVLNTVQFIDLKYL